MNITDDGPVEAQLEVAFLEQQLQSDAGISFGRRRRRSSHRRPHRRDVVMRQHRTARRQPRFRRLARTDASPTVHAVVVDRFVIAPLLHQHNHHQLVLTQSIQLSVYYHHLN